MPTIRLFSARACPFAHRSRLVLSHKQVPFELIEIDLKNKPAWFDSKLSGYGKVPALEHGEIRIWESAVINEYLDEVFATPVLLPAEPGARARARIWIDFANTRLAVGFGALLRAATLTAQDAARKELLAQLAYLESAGLGQNAGSGPFFFGAQPSLVDFALYPWFERWSALDHYRAIPLPAEYVRLSGWLSALHELEAVGSHRNAPEFYVQRYAAIAAPRQAVA